MTANSTDGRQSNLGAHLAPLGDRLACPHVRQLEAFQSHRAAQTGDQVWINANELPYRSDGYALDLGECHRYAGPIGASLIEGLAKYARVPADRVIATRGADEAIELLVRAFCRSGQDAIVHCPPTYVHYRVAARAHDVRVFDADLTSEYELNQDALARAPDNTKIVFLCNPNNPTGNLLNPRDILEVVRRFDGRALVVVDEAYIEFCPASTIVPMLESCENLVVVRTLSKAFGLAGLHMGYAIAGPTIISALHRIIQPYPIPYPCAEIALQALTEVGLSRMRRSTKQIIETRERFASALLALREVDRVLPSHTNFVLAKFHARSRAWKELLQRGVVARQPEEACLASAIRFSIGTPGEMAMVLAALGEHTAPELSSSEALTGGE